jgi:hypothetical protein
MQKLLGDSHAQRCLSCEKVFIEEALSKPSDPFVELAVFLNIASFFFIDGRDLTPIRDISSISRVFTIFSTLF